MGSRIYDEYKHKLRTPKEAVNVVKSGDWVDYTVANGFPALLDAALAERKEELYDVKIRGNLIFGPIKAAECDPDRIHFIYNSWHFSSYERKLGDKGMCSYIPMIFRNHTELYRKFLHCNVAMVCATPMDKHGYFNLSTSIGTAKGILDNADTVIIEVNENLPKVNGCFDECIHISDVDMIVEGEHGPLVEILPTKPSDVDIKIAENIIPYITDGAMLQLGIGGLPGVIGEYIANSDLRNLGMHTELASDAYYKMYEAGKLTNKCSTLYPGKGLAGIFLGTEKFYDWIDDNPGILGYPIELVNSPEKMGQLNKLISINGGIAVDIYGQVCSETVGERQISGTGGQLDFLTGAGMSQGGKGFICLPSVRKDKEGNLVSNIVTKFSDGDIITTPRSQSNYIVTEYGAVNLSGRTTWERTELIVSIAHPDFREELIKNAADRGIWTRSNRR